MTAQFQLATPKTGRDWMKGTLLTLTLLAGLWWVLTSGSMASWLVWLPALASAAWVNGRLGRSSGERLSLTGLARFVPFFIWQSLRGGVDVALRTLTPRMRIQPGFSRYRTRLKTLSAQTFFANCVSLLPGTLVPNFNKRVNTAITTK